MLYQISFHHPVTFLQNEPNRASFLFIFILFTWQIQQKFDYKWLNHRWCAWDSNPGGQNGRCREIHWAIEAPHILLLIPLWHSHIRTHQRRRCWNRSSLPTATRRRKSFRWLLKMLDSSDHCFLLKEKNLQNCCPQMNQIVAIALFPFSCSYTRYQLEAFMMVARKLECKKSKD